MKLRGRKNMRKILLVTIILCIIFVNSVSVLGIVDTVKTTIGKAEDIDDIIIDKMEQRHLPGLSASIVIGNTVRWQNAYGYANIERNVMVTNDTLFKIASVSKTITATALMQLYDQGLFNLSDPINEYLPYLVIHPLYPSTPITFHMLLTHSSGINDNWEYLFYFQGDAPIPFQVFLEEYLVPGGLYYDAENNFCHWEPGSSWDYSNIAVALVGYLVEVISGVNFTEYVESSLFSALEMDESAWYLRDLNVSHIAMPYHWNGAGYQPYGHIGYVDVPAGDLRTSSSQLIHFLTTFINNGVYKGQVILENSTVQLMLTPQLPFQPNIGLIWWKSLIGGRTVWGHNGVDFGARAMMQFDPSTNIGVVVLTNGEGDLSDICDTLFDYAETVVNVPPDVPVIEGPTTGKPNTLYTYSIETKDTEGDDVYFCINWGDDTGEVWIGPYASGEEVLATHTWSKMGTYTIKVKAKDEYDGESDWAVLSVTMPKNLISYLGDHRIFNWLFERFPNALAIIRWIFNS